MAVEILIIATLAVVALAGVALWLHHLFEGECLTQDLWREMKLSRTDLAALDRKWRENTDRSDLIVSLTTIPSRIDCIGDTLASLLDQSRLPARIILNVPAFSEREQRPYVVPQALRGLAAVEIRECADWGPATKLIPTLLVAAPNQPIVVVDDDRIYPPWLIERYEKAARAHPDAALTMAGWVVPGDLTDRPTTIISNLLMRPPAAIRAPRIRRATGVDVVQGVMSYLVRPRFFDLSEMTDFDDGPGILRLVDDVRTSALCLADKLVIPAKSLGFIPKRRRRLFEATALGLINRGTGGDEERHNTIAIRHYAGRWRVGGRP